MGRLTKIIIIFTAVVAVLTLILVLTLKKDKIADIPSPSPTETVEPTAPPSKLPPAYHTPEPTEDPVGNIFPLKYDWLNRSRLDLMTEYEDMDIYDLTDLNAYLSAQTDGFTGMSTFYYQILETAEQGKINTAVYDVLGILPPEMSSFDFTITGMTAVSHMLPVFRNIVDTENLNTETVYMDYPARAFPTAGINKYGIAFVCTESSEITALNILAGLRGLSMFYRDELRIEILRDIFKINFETREKFVEDENGLLFRYHMPINEWIPICSMDTVGEAIRHGFLIDLGSYNDLMEIDAAAVVLFSGQYQEFVDKYDELNPDSDRNYVKEKLDEEIRYYCSLMGVESDYFKVYMPLYWETRGYDFNIEDLNDTLNSGFDIIHVDSFGNFICAIGD